LTTERTPTAPDRYRQSCSRFMGFQTGLWPQAIVLRRCRALRFTWALKRKKPSGAG